jgi:hypothetical protein
MLNSCSSNSSNLINTVILIKNKMLSGEDSLAEVDEKEDFPDEDSLQMVKKQTPSLALD